MTTHELTLFTLWNWLRLTPARMAKFRYYERNKDACKLRAKTHRRSEAGKAWMRDWMKKRKRESPEFKIEHTLRTRIWWALRRAGGNKTEPTLRLLGVDNGEIIWRHLDTLLQHGMTRENYGSVWEIDHKKPCASFDLTDSAQQRACFHYTNLQPLLVAENRSKGAKF